MSTRAPSGIIPLQFDYKVVEFDPEEFDVAIRGAGVGFVHYRAMKCPVGIVDRDDSRRPHEDHSGCFNGFIFTRAGAVTALFVSNNDSSDGNEIGLIDGSSVQITTTRTYDDSEEEVQVAPFDRFELSEEAVVVPHWQLVEAHVSGRDRLSFPPTKIVDVIDSHGKRYGVGDYTIEEGQILWIGANRPGFNVDANKGDIYAVRYLYRPSWYVARIMHQTRMARVETATESAKLVRMPQSFTLQRERIFLKEEKDDQAPNPESQRQVFGPRKGSYGPR